MKILATALLLGALPAASQTPTPAPAPPSIQLPQLSDAQHWDRAAEHFILMFNAYLAHSRELGQTPEEVSTHFVKLVGDGRPKEMGPLSMMKAMYHNLTMIPNTRFEVLEASEALARFRVSRAYAAYYEPKGEMFGMKVEDYERGLFLFQRALAEARGMSCEQRREGDWIVWQLARKAAK